MQIQANAAAKVAEWLVTDGEAIIGPVSLDLISRGIEAGRLSFDFKAKRQDSEEWTPLFSIPELVAGESSGVRRTPNEIDEESLASVRAADTLGEAALHLLALATSRFDSPGGLVHLSRGKDLMTTCAFGPNAPNVLGRVVARGDAAVTALETQVRSGWLADRGRASTSQRILSLGLSDAGAVAFSLGGGDRIVGLLELAAPRDRVAFSPDEVSSLEQAISAGELWRFSGSVSATMSG